MTVYQWSEMAAEWGYPLMTGICVMWIFICIVQWFGRRRYLDIVLAFFFILAATAFMLLAVATGRNAPIDYMLAVAMVRIIWLAAALVSLFYTIAFIWRRWRRWWKWQHSEKEAEG